MRYLYFFLRKFRDLKLRSKLIISYVILITLPTVITGVVYYNTSSGIILESAKQNKYEIVKKNNRIIDLKLSQIQDSTMKLILDGDLYRVFSTVKPNDDYELIQMDRQLSQIMNKYFSSFSDIYTMNIVTSYFKFGTSDFTFLKRNFFSKTNLYANAVAAKGRLQWVPTYDVKDMFGLFEEKGIVFEYPYLFSAVKQLNITAVQPIWGTGSNSFGAETRGLDKGIERPVLVLSFKEELFKNIYNSSLSLKDEYNYIISKDGIVISHPDRTKIGKKETPVWLKTAVSKKSGTIIMNVDGKRTLICYDTLKVNGWVSAFVVPVNSLLKSLPSVRYYSLYLGIGLTVLAILLAFIISGWIAKPLKKLLFGIRRMAEGDFNSKVSVPSNDEIGLLVHNFNDMNGKIQTLIKEKYEVEIREKEAEIMALNLQLNPHFLSNTLNTINWIAIENKQPVISKMLISLSNMLEYTMRNNKEIVCFKEDLEWLKCYIYIMTNRYFEVFEVKFDIATELETLIVPKLFLQPFIENAMALKQ